MEIVELVGIIFALSIEMLVSVKLGLLLKTISEEKRWLVGCSKA